jgi:hypothetical protein
MVDRAWGMVDRAWGMVDRAWGMVDRAWGMVDRAWETVDKIIYQKRKLEIHLPLPFKNTIYKFFHVL